MRKSDCRNAVLALAAVVGFSGLTVRAEDPRLDRPAKRIDNGIFIQPTRDMLTPGNTVDLGDPRGPGSFGPIGFETSEGYANGNINGQPVGSPFWTNPAGNTTWAQVSTTNPGTGARSLLQTRDTTAGEGTGRFTDSNILASVADGACQFDADLRIQGTTGPDFYVFLLSNNPTADLLTTVVRFYYADADGDTVLGDILVADDDGAGGAAYFVTGAEYTSAAYRHLRVQIIPQINTIRYLYNNVLIYTGHMLPGGGTKVDQVSLGHDNYSPTRTINYDQVQLAPLVVTGACCDNNTAPCQDNILVDDCIGPNDRFVPFTTCAAAVFTPACGSTTPGDLCTNAVALTGQGAMASFTTSDALTGGPDVSCVPNGPGPVYHDRWFDYTVPTLAPSATSGGNVVLTTLGSDHDTVVTVYGPIVGNPTAAQLCQDITDGNIGEVACDDDIRPENLLSYADFPAAQGEKYRIRIGTIADTVSGDGMISVDFFPNPVAGVYESPARCCSVDGTTCSIISRATCESLGRFWQDSTRFLEGADPTLSPDYLESAFQGCKTQPCPTLGDRCYNAIDLENALGASQGTHSRGIVDKIYFKYTLGPNETVVLDTCGSGFDTVLSVYASFGAGFDPYDTSPSNGDCGNLIKINDDCSFGDPDNTSEGASQTASCFAAGGELTSCLCVSREEVDLADATANGRILIEVGGFNPFRADTGIAGIDPVLNPFDGAVSMNLTATLIQECFVCEVQNTIDGQPVSPIAETEGNCANGQSNRTNDGCNSPGAIQFQTIAAPTPGTPRIIRGTAGVYVDNVVGQRADEDWYDITFANAQTVEYRLVAADFPARITIFRAGASDPCLFEAAQSVVTNISCLDTEDFFTVNLCAGRYFFRIKPEVPAKPTCDSAYLLKISAAAPPAPDCCPADTNGDGQRNGKDVQKFVNYLVNGVVEQTGFGECYDTAFCHADMNGDHVLSTADIPGFVTALLATLPCPAAPLCSNPDACQLPDQANAIRSDLEVGSEFSTADNFMPAVSGDITNVCWWGIYLQAGVNGAESCGPGPGDAFTIKFYDDAAGCPGNEIASRNVTATTTPTGEDVLGLYAEFNHTAPLVPGVAVTAGTCYWIEIVNDVSGTGCFWFWETSLKGDADSMQHSGAVPYLCQIDSTGTDQAFCLNINFGPTGCSDYDQPGQCCYVDGSQQTQCVQTTIDDCVIVYDAYFFDLAGVCGEDDCPTAPCEVTCTLPGDTPEQEGCGYDKNGGCNDDNAEIPPFDDLGPLVCGTPKNICGNAWSDGATRDTDWYSFQLTQEAQVAVSLAIRVDGQIFLERLTPFPNCDAPTLISSRTSPFNDCSPVTIQACLQAGTYVVVVTGSSTFTPHACEVDSQYRLTVSCTVPCCSITCPGGTTQEAEACNASTNAGCNATPNAYESLGDVCTTPAVRCGTSWAAGNSRDTDWWGTIVLTQPTEVSWTLTSEFPGTSFAIRVDDCASPVVGNEIAASVGCQPATATECLPAGTWIIFVAPGNADGSGVFDGVPCGTRNDYILTVSCNGACELNLPPNDECANAITVAVPSVTNLNNATATINPTDMAIPCYFSGTPTVPDKTMWYKFTAPANGLVTVSTCDVNTTAGDTILSVYEECGPTWSIVGCSDDEATCAVDAYYSKVVMDDLVPGEDYFISVGSFSTAFSGPIRMIITSP